MQRTKGLLFEGEEHCVDEFDIFEVVIDHVVEFKSLQYIIRKTSRSMIHRDIQMTTARRHK